MWHVSSLIEMNEKRNRECVLYLQARCGLDNLGDEETFLALDLTSCWSPDISCVETVRRGPKAD